jgi:hemoglobin-like flavoprotein
MTASDRRKVRESFPEVKELAGPLSLLFYGRLFEQHPALRAMFHGDIAQQGLKLMDMLTAVVDNVDELDTLRPVLHAMGQRHVAYGAKADHYQAVEDSLLWAMGQAFGADFDAETKGAWRKVVAEVSAAMKEGAAMLPALRE